VGGKTSVPDKDSKSTFKEGQLLTGISMLRQKKTDEAEHTADWSSTQHDWERRRKRGEETQLGRDGGHTG